MRSPRNGPSMSGSGAEVVERLVLDSSAYSLFRSGHQRALDVIAGAITVVMPAIVIGELEAAFEMGSRARENRSVLHAFVSEPFVTVAETTRAVAQRYGRVFGALRRAGTPIPTNDIWIAATTLELDGHLLTFDGDFRHVADLPATILSVD